MIRKTGSRGSCSSGCGASDVPGEAAAYAMLPAEDQFILGVYRWLCLSASNRASTG